MSKTRKVNKKEIAKYMELPYTYEVVKEDGRYFVSVKELEGCMGDGDTLEEAMKSVRISQELWIETALEMGKEIPLPEDKTEYSGRILLRLPKYLHRRLAEMAKEEGVSLNQYIVSLLSERSTMNMVIKEIDEKISTLKEKPDSYENIKIVQENSRNNYLE